MASIKVSGLKRGDDSGFMSEYGKRKFHLSLLKMGKSFKRRATLSRKVFKGYLPMHLRHNTVYWLRVVQYTRTVTYRETMVSVRRVLYGP